VAASLIFHTDSPCWVDADLQSTRLAANGE
jgi:hypothetical protein